MNHRLFALVASTALAIPTSLTCQSLATIYAGGNSGSSTWTNQFDITVTNPLGITIIGFDVNCENTRSGGVGSPFTLDVWITAPGGTYLGNEANPAAWTRVAGGNSVSGPIGTPTRVDTTDLVLAPGTYGIALEYNGTAMAYTNGNGANQAYSNADISLSLGASSTGLFGTPVYTPRVWNGEIHYFNGTARWWEFGAGCPGTAGVPTIAPGNNSLPQLGGLFFLDIANLPSGGAVVAVLIGTSNTIWGPSTLPLDLAQFGAPSCNLLVSLDSTATVGTATSTAQFLIGIPVAPALSGLGIHWQAALVDTASNALGLVFSAGGTSYLGT